MSTGIKTRGAGSRRRLMDRAGNNAVWIGGIALAAYLFGFAVISAGLPDDPPEIELSNHYFPASEKCQFKEVKDCDSADIERATFSVSYYPGETGLAAGGAIQIRFGNIFNDMVMIREDRNWLTPNLHFDHNPEYTTAYILKDGVRYPCHVKTPGHVPVELENICSATEPCDGHACCLLLCRNKVCLENFGIAPKNLTSCDYLTVITNRFLSHPPAGLGVPSSRDRIIITFGDSTASENGRYRVPCLPLSQSVLASERNGPPGTPFVLLHNQYPGFEYPTLEVGGVHEGVSCFEVLAPTTPADGVVTVTVKALQAVSDPARPLSMRNAYLAKNYQGTIHIDVEGMQPGGAIPPDQTFSPSDGGMIEFDIHFGALPTGIKKVHVYEVGDSGVCGTSNPIVYGTVEKTYWGVFQSHSMQGGHANQTPAFCYEFAKNAARLDFYALSEHCNTTYFDWNYTKDICDYYNNPEFPKDPSDPIRFVTFPAYEWTSIDYGHRHVIFKNRAEADKFLLIPCEADRNNSVMESETLLDFHSEFHAPGAPEAIIIPHHTSRNLDPKSPGWDYTWVDPAFPAPDKQSLVEIFSTHGTSEKWVTPTPSDPNAQAENYLAENNQKFQLKKNRHGFVQWALRHGFKFGFISGSDNHAGTSGSLFGGTLLPSNVTFYSRSGLTAVLAPALTRDDLWTALKENRTYATTGVRIYLDVQANGHAMGEEFYLMPQQEPAFAIHAAGTDDITDVWLIRILVTDEPGPGAIHFKEIRFPDSTYDGSIFQSTYQDAQVLPGKLYCYYIRVRQDDGHLAWSSPNWIHILQP
jgi:hypothetical protein